MRSHASEKSEDIALHPRSARARALREEAIVEAAADLFMVKPIEDVKMTDIAERANVGVASIYRYFDTKSNVALRAGSVLWKRFGDEIDEVIDRLDPSTPAILRVRAILGQYLKMAQSNLRFMAFLDELDRIILAGDFDAAQIAEYEAGFARFRRVYDRLCLDGREDGTIRGDIDHNLVYDTALHALMNEAQKLERGNVVPSDDFSTTRELECLVEMTLFYLEGSGR